MHIQNNYNHRINIKFNIFFKLSKLELIQICNLHNILIKYKCKLTKLELIYKIHYYLFNNNIYYKIYIFHHEYIKKVSKKVSKKIKKPALKPALKIKKSIKLEDNNLINNASFGISCEYAICKIYNLKNTINYKFIDKKNITELKKTLILFKNEFNYKYGIKCIDHIGNLNKSTDFICGNTIVKNKMGNTKSIVNNTQITLSVKSNISKSFLVCPQYIGQPTYKSFINKIKSFKLKYPNLKKINLNDFNLKNEKIKTHIKNIIYYNFDKLFYIYLKHLFCCDYLLWVYLDHTDNKKINYKLFNTNFNNMKLPKLNKNKFHFTKTIKNWNYSNTIKYDNITIGIFQFSNTRKNINFRFYFKNLLLILNKK